MNLKKKLLKESRLYVILDKKRLRNKPVFGIADKIKDSGIDIVQLRDKESKIESLLKDAYALRKSSSNSKTLFIINDYIDIAKITDSDGIHLGQEDTPIEIARQILGKDKIIGVSCHNLRQAKEAQNRGADYISIGPIFSTPTKPEYKPVGLGLIKEVNKIIKIPFFAIGGIDQKNLNKVLSHQVKRVALCKAICQVKDISLAAKIFSNLLH